MLSMALREALPIIATSSRHASYHPQVLQCHGRLSNFQQISDIPLHNIGDLQVKPRLQRLAMPATHSASRHVQYVLEHSVVPICLHNIQCKSRKRYGSLSTTCSNPGEDSPWHFCILGCACAAEKLKQDSLCVQDGNGFILIDVPDENFTEAYGVLLTSLLLRIVAACLYTHMTNNQLVRGSR